MNPGDKNTPPAGHADGVRRQVVEAAVDAMRDTSGAVVSDGRPLHLYLALLQDRLPVYASAVKGLADRVGRGDVAENLASVARATIAFYQEILASKVSVFADPDQLFTLRRVLGERRLGPHAAHDAVAAYLSGERGLGRVAADVDPAACAHLLLGACVNYAFTRTLLGEAPPDERYVHEIVRGLRLTSEA